MSRLVRFLVAHPVIHRTWHRIATRGKAEYELPDGSIQFPTCWIDDLVWRDLERDPAFVAALDQGREDYAEGRFTRYVFKGGELINEKTGEPFA